MTVEQITVLKRSINGIDMRLCSDDEKAIIRFLLDNGLCKKPSDLSETTIYISEKGKDYLAANDEMIREQAQNKRDKRFDKKIKILQTAIPLILFVVGLFVEHYAGIITWFISLFH